jgi:hypothetical protein
VSELPVTPELWSVAEVGLEYGIRLASDMKETFHPALVTETAEGERALDQVFLGLADAEAGNDPLGAAVSILGEKAEVVRAAIVLDGYTHIDDVREDAILVRVGERGMDCSHEFAQRYARSGLRKKFRRVGNVGYVGESARIFS